MRLRENLIDIFKHVAFDEELNRLLYYLPRNPLNPSLPNVTEMDNFHEIQRERIIRSPIAPKIDTEPINRICMYLGNSTGTSNMKVSSQRVIFDVFSHIEEFDSIDARSLWICERIHELVHGHHVTGVGKMIGSDNLIIGSPPEGYIGYRLVFNFGSVK